MAIQQSEQMPNHSPYYTNLSEAPAPALMENGWNDDLFPVDQTVDYYNKVRAVYPTAAMKLFYLDLGHSPRSAASASTADVGKLTAAQNAWFAYYLKNEGSEPGEAHGGVTAITSVCPVGSCELGARIQGGQLGEPGTRRNQTRRHRSSRRLKLPAPLRRTHSPLATCAAHKLPATTPPPRPTNSRRRLLKASRSPVRPP